MKEKVDYERRREKMQIVEAARQKWSLTQDALDRLLASLGPDRDIAADRYLRIRRDLVRLFEWRGCSTPDEYADETINRCARKIADGEEIRDIKTYSIGVARMLLHEMAREQGRHRPLDEVPEPINASPDTSIDLEPRVEALSRSLAQLSDEDRYLILNYYQGNKGERVRSRKMLMRLFGIPAGTLRMRALRLREKLRLCVDNYKWRSPSPAVSQKLYLSQSTRLRGPAYAQ
jgi:DNA-directed RNA polymerase specialized sigma24 family protein